MNLISMLVSWFRSSKHAATAAHEPAPQLDEYEIGRGLDWGCC